MKITSNAQFERAEQSTLVLGVFQDGDKKKPEPSCNHDEFESFLGRLAENEVFKGKRGSIYFVRSTEDATPNVLFAGLGRAEDITGETLRISGANIAKRLDSEKVKAAALDLASFHHKGLKKSLEMESIATALAEGALFSMYQFDTYKSEKVKSPLAEIAFYTAEKKHLADLKRAVETATAENDALTIARDLSNEPASHLTPLELAKRAQKLAKDYGISCKILNKAALKKEGMGAILGVGQGSINPPCLIVLDYKPKKAKKTVALVGKAVTFDTGGISLKPGPAMEDMKHDMSGGADVIAATLLAARLGCRNRIVCIVPAAENMPDGNAIVPSAILKTRNGKTIEVQNTDAEGRLILSDALDYAQDYSPDVILDAATLTGAVVMALSNVAAGIMGNDEGVMEKFKAAAKETEERYVELPMFPEYGEDMKSKIADLKNIGGDRGAGCQKGGAFLKEFIKDGNKWIHVDIAGTAWNLASTAYHPKHGATGHSVRTFARFAIDY